MTSAQETSFKLPNLITAFNRSGAGIAAAAQLARASLPTLGVVTLGTAAFSASTQRGDSAVVMDISASQALGEAQDDVVWYRGIIDNSSVRATGILIRGAAHDYVLTAGHAVSTTLGIINAANMSIGNGTSYLNDLGTTSGVTSIYLIPTYTTGNMTGGDYAFLKLSNRISAPNSTFSIGLNPQEGDSILFAGYGLPGTIQNGATANTGNVMGFYANYSYAGLASWNSAYDSGIFSGANDSGYENTRGSGGPVKSYNSSTGTWETFGMTVASNFSNATFFYNFNQADENFQSYLNNVVIPVIPEPVSAALLGLGAGLLAFRRNRAIQSQCLFVSRHLAPPPATLAAPLTVTDHGTASRAP